MFADGQPPKEVATEGAEETVLEAWLCVKVEVVGVVLDEELYEMRLSECPSYFARVRSGDVNNSYLEPELML
jgi:hypothetical protein